MINIRDCGMRQFDKKLCFVTVGRLLRFSTLHGNTRWTTNQCKSIGGKILWRTTIPRLCTIYNPFRLRNTLQRSSIRILPFGLIHLPFSRCVARAKALMTSGPRFSMNRRGLLWHPSAVCQKIIQQRWVLEKALCGCWLALFIIGDIIECLYYLNNTTLNDYIPYDIHIESMEINDVATILRGTAPLLRPNRNLFDLLSSWYLHQTAAGT